MSFNSTLQKTVNSTVVALNGVTTGTTTSAAGLVINIDQSRNVEFDSLVMNVTAAITTTSLVVQTLWQVSDDGTTWRTLYPMNGAAYVQVAATGTGSLVTTNYCVAANGWNPSKQFIRAAVLSTGATGAAGDNVTISYGFRKRFVGAAG